MLVEIWFFCSNLGKKISILKRENIILSDKINITHKAGHVGFSFDSKPIDDDTKEIFGFSPVSDLSDDDLYQELIAHYMSHRYGGQLTDATSFPGQIKNDYQSFKTALDLGRPVWKWNFSFDVIGEHPLEKLEKIKNGSLPMPRYSFFHTNCMRFPKSINIPLPDICYKDLEEFIIEAVKPIYDTECFIKNQYHISKCNIRINPCSLDHIKKIRKEVPQLPIPHPLQRPQVKRPQEDRPPWIPRFREKYIKYKLKYLHLKNLNKRFADGI